MYKNILVAFDGSELSEKALHHALALAGAAGAKVTLGARPEHIEASKEPVTAGNAVKGHVQLAEHLGDTIFLHATLSGATEPMTIRTDPENPVDTGDMAWLTLPPQRCFLFDERGRTLSRAAG